MIPPPPYRRQSSANSPLRTSPFSDRRKPFLIGVAGGTASGKSSVCDKIIQAVIRQNIGTTDKQIIAISQDSFYRNLEPKESVEAVKGNFNFDHPDAFDHKMLISCLEDIMESRPTRIPVYDFKTNSRVPDKWTAVNPSDVVIVEGILIFYHKEVRDLFDMKLFVDTDADTRLARRVLRDLEERNRSLEHILNQYTRLVKPAFEEFCFPTKKYADVIIPRGADNTVAIELIVQHVLGQFPAAATKTGDGNNNNLNVIEEVVITEEEDPRYARPRYSKSISVPQGLKNNTKNAFESRRPH